MAGLSLEHKRNFHILRWASCAIVVVLLVAACYYAYMWYTTGSKPPLIPLPASAYADPSVSETPLTQKQIDEYAVPATHPRYISIPALGVARARVMVVELTKDGTIDTPRNAEDTGWYSQSAFPGQGYGAVLIDGHSGVFANLAKLANGDKIIIERGDGKKFTYDVVENNTESLKEANAEGIQHVSMPYDSDKEGLGLVADAGNWVPRDHVFDKRTLVRAVAE